MIVIASDAALFGPYGHIEEMSDRIRVWADGAREGDPGSDLPFNAIGAYQVHDIDVPAGFVAGDYDWIAGALVRKAPPDPGTEH